MNNNNYGANSYTNQINKKGKYKTMICKHYDTQSGCSYGEKCQFAHGVEELKSFSSVTSSR